MKITQVAKLVGASTDEIRWLETLSYVQPSWTSSGKRIVRDYSQTEVKKIELIIKYRRQGFEHHAAFARAIKELEQPPLI